ncbi:MAG: LacI family DNA-binding transcriptional regulator [Actinomycetota bacterium]
MNEPRRVGIKDVARAAGVSTTTVSHALSGKGRLPRSTRDRVRGVARELGYVPHPAAASLAGGRTGLVAAFVSVPGNAPIAFTDIDYYVGLVNGATRAAIERGLALVVAPSTAGVDAWNRLPLDGVIVIDPADGDPTLPMLRARGLPIVFVGRDPNGTALDLVVQNDRHASTRAVLEHLDAAGARHAGVLTLRTFETFTEDCLDSYRLWCRERGVAPVIHEAPADSTATQTDFRAAAEAFVRRPDLPDAVFCLYERQAVELLAAARSNGIRIPRDLMVVTISEVGFAQTTDPPLTALEVNQSVLGERAVALLAEAVEGRPAVSVLDVPTRISPRASTRR